jgi:sulfur carrier protein
MEITLNGESRRIAAGQSIADLVAELSLGGKRYAVERNGEIVPRGRHGETLLEAGDRIEIVVAVGGG